MIKDPYTIVKTVSITEKTNSLMENNQYVFIVNKKANKNDVKQAVQFLFERKVKSVNIVNRIGKTKRNRFGVGKKADQKRAIITLQDGEEAIELF